MKKIGILGLGKLGVCLTALFTKYYKVYGVDVLAERVKQIADNVETFEPRVNEYLSKYKENLTVSTDFDILKDCEIVFLITQTPSLSSGKFDIAYVKSALKKLHRVNPSCLAVISSTINIGDVDKLKGLHSRVAYNPEFVKQGSIMKDFENPKFILIGSYTKEDGELIAEIWRQYLVDEPIYIVSPLEAEITKLCLNVSYTLGISFANVVGEFCEKVGADVNKVLDVIYQDHRNYRKGLGFSGPCFPRDVNSFLSASLEKHVMSGVNLSKLLNLFNKEIVRVQLSKIRGHAKQIRSKGSTRVGILGVAYKSGVSYIYESQPIQIAKELLKKGYQVFVYDKMAMETAKTEISEAYFCNSIEECVEKSDIVFIGLPDKDFTELKTDKVIINPWR
jgi:nucleotide sugar dehydrogenase